MGTSYVGEIRMFAGNFAPAGWAFCHGLCGRGEVALLCRLRQRIARPGDSGRNLSDYGDCGRATV